MKIYFASDHAGFALKGALMSYVRSLGYEVEDRGPHELVPGDDYPMQVKPAAEAVVTDALNGLESRAIILGGSGQGEAIEANRMKGIRAAVYYGSNAEIVRLSREHNDANVFSIGARFVGEEEAREMVRLWLETAFSREERHVRRIAELDV